MIKKIWITGASSGIGKALAIKFANEGWQVAASARREKLLKGLNEQNSNIHSFPLDVKNEDETSIMCQTIELMERADAMQSYYIDIDGTLVNSAHWNINFFDC